MLVLRSAETLLHNTWSLVLSRRVSGVSLIVTQLKLVSSRVKFNVKSNPNVLKKLV